MNNSIDQLAALPLGKPPQVDLPPQVQQMLTQAQQTAQQAPQPPPVIAPSPVEQAPPQGSFGVPGYNQQGQKAPAVGFKQRLTRALSDAVFAIGEGLTNGPGAGIISATPQGREYVHEQRQQAAQAESAQTGLANAQAAAYQAKTNSLLNPAASTIEANWHPIPGTNWEINYKTGETKNMEGVPLSSRAENRKPMFFGPVNQDPSKPPVVSQGYTENGMYYMKDGTPLPDGWAPFGKNSNQLSPIQGALLIRSFLAHGYSDQPGLLKAASEIAKASGLPFSDEALKAIASMPPGWQVGENGEYLGYHSPLFAKGATVQRLQFSRELIPTVDETIKAISDQPQLFGMIKGRANQILSGNLGASNAPFYGQLVNLHNIATAWMRLHANSDKAREDFLELLKTAQSPQNLMAGLGSIRRQADIYANYGVAPGGIFGRAAEQKIIDQSGGGKANLAPGAASAPSGSIQMVSPDGKVWSVPKNRIGVFTKNGYKRKK